MLKTRNSHKKASFSLLFVSCLILVIALTTFGAITLSESIDKRNSLERASQNNLTISQNMSVLLSSKPYDYLSSDTNIFSGININPDAAFVVDDDGDSNDANPGDGVCADIAENCTLRAAVQESNASAGNDAITFNLSAPAVIQLNSAGLTISENVTISGFGARSLTVNGNANTASGIFNVNAGVTANISNLTIADSAGRGVNNNGILTLSEVSVSGNSVGIYNTKDLILTRSLINKNSAGGIYITAPSTTDISNTTITDNQASSNGAGIYSLSPNVTLNNVTITGNAATNSGGGFYYSNTVSGIFVRNTIIAGNTAAFGADIFSSDVTNIAKFTSNGNNLIGKSANNIGFENNTNGDKVGTPLSPIDPLLGPLRNNGGQTDTHAVLPLSQAKNAGNVCVINLSCPANNPPTFLTSDQRGGNHFRFWEASVEIGAYESYNLAPVTNMLVPANRGTGSGAFELTVNGSNFTADSTVKWNGQNKATTLVTNNQLKAQILAADIATAGQFPVTVTNPAPGGGTSAPINFTVADCAYSLSPTFQNFTNVGGTGNIAVSTTNGCAWTAQVSAGAASWISITNGSSGTGTGTVQFAVSVNTGQLRTGTITIGGQTFNISQGTGCTFSITPPNQNFPTAGAGSGTIAVSTNNPQCTWSATANAPWITITGGATGTGNESVSYTVTANAGLVRTGTITIADKTFTITQANGCTYTIDPSSAILPNTNASGTVTVGTSDPQCTWSATANAPWITITGGATGTGPGTMSYTLTDNTSSTRSSTITIAGKTFNISQISGCTYTLAPASPLTIPAAGGNRVVTITANAGCAWTTVVPPTTPEWISVSSGASGSGNGAVTLSVTANTGPEREKTLTIAGQAYLVRQTSGCAYEINPPTTSFPVTGGTGTISVTTSAGCDWAAAVTTPSTPEWVTITGGASGSGNGTVTYSVAANNGPARSKTITVAGKVFTISQNDGCVYTIDNPPMQNFTSAAANAVINVSTSPGCTWSAAVTTPTTPEWITITGGASGSGSGAVTYSVAANTGPARSKTITVAGKVFTVTQAEGCVYTINTPPNQNFSASANTGTINVTTNPGCAWTAVVTNPETPDWITITNVSAASGNGIVTYTVAANTGPARSKTITVAGKIFTVSQDSGCVYTINNPPTQGFPAVGGTNGLINVTTGAGCTWTVAVTNPETPDWITINGSANRTGSGTVTYSVAANTGPARSKTITVAGKVFTVTQTDGCTYTLAPASPLTIPAAGGNRVVTITANAGCAWTTVVPPTTPEWISVSSGASGSGNGAVTLSVTANTGPEREKTLTIAGQAYLVRQTSGCAYSLTPTSAPNFPAAGGSGNTFSVTTSAGCNWTAAVSTDAASWITINSGSTGSGNGTVTYTVAANNGPLRSGTITVNGQVFTVTQINGCTYTLNPTSAPAVSAAGSTASVTVGTSNGQCMWSATVAANTPWITLNGTPSGTGPGSVSYTVAVNTGAQRTGVITIAGLTFTVTQLSPFVTNLNDSGPGSLRQAILNANSSPGNDIINFQPSLSGTIILTSGELVVANNGTLQINGLGADVITITSNYASRIFYLNQAVFSLSDVTLTGGNGTGLGNFDGNKSGGAIYVNEGTLNLNRVNVNNNVITVPTGVRNRSFGGGIYFLYGTNHRIQNSTISNNSSTQAAGIYNLTSLLTIENSTLIGNVNLNIGNTDPNNGGALYNVGNAVLNNVTIAKNQASPLGAGVYVGNGSIHISNTIIAENSGAEISFIEGEITFGGNNLIGDAPGDSTNTVNPINYRLTDVLNTPPKIGALALYGGGVPTAALMPGSPAINAGSNGATELIKDQRGSGRVIDSTIDIGAFEYNIPIEPTASTLPSSAIGDSYNQTLTASRIDGANPNEQFSFEIVDGSLPSGLNLFQSGAIFGNATSGGFYSFTVKATGADGMAGANKYTLSVGCTYSISPTTQPFGSAAGSGTVNVTTSAGCPWNAVVNTNSTWITVSNASNRSGSGTLNYNVAANPGLLRSGTITIAGQTITVNQANGCSFNLGSSSQNFNASGGTNSFMVNASDSLCQWNSASNDPQMITVTSNASRTGSGAVNYTVSATVGPQRFGTISAAGMLFNVNQNSGCGYSPNPANMNSPVGGGAGSFTVNSTQGCPWTAVSDNSWVTVTAGSTGNGNGGTVNFSVAANTGAARLGTITLTGGQKLAINQAGTTAGRAAFDYDGDGKSDVSVFRPSNGIWYLLNSQTGFGGLQFGANGDKLVPADYDGDGKTDTAVFRGNAWFIQRSTLGFTNIQFGAAGDVPAVADFDGDGKADIAVYRPSDGTWFIQRSTAGFYAIQFGINGDVPMPGDFDGDGKADIALFRPSNGIWYILGSTQGFYGVQFGATGDKLVPADYDGDGKTDLAVFRPSNATWYINRSQLGSTNIQFGVSTDLPSPADYDGDGRADVAVYRTDTWFIQRSTAGFMGIQFGGSGDQPIPNVYVR